VLQRGKNSETRNITGFDYFSKVALRIVQLTSPNEFQAEKNHKSFYVYQNDPEASF